MSTLGIALAVVCAVLVLLPPKWDPAIQLKERNLRKRKEIK